MKFVLRLFFHAGSAQFFPAASGMSLRAGLPALLVSVLLTACGDPDDSLRSLRSNGIRVGYAVEAPYAFLGPDGEVSGEAPEIARHVVKKLGIARLEWRQMEFGELIDALQAKRIDVIAAGMFITPERQVQVLFSAPTYSVRPALLVARGNPKRIVSYGLAAGRADIQLAVLAGAVEERMLRRLSVPDARLKVVPDALTGRRAVESGLADALLLSEPTIRWMARNEQLGRTEMLAAPSSSQGDDVYGHPAFAFRRADRQLLEAWNAVLLNYLGSSEHAALLLRFGLHDEVAGGGGER